MQKVLIVLGSKSDLPITEKGQSKLKELGLSYSLRVASAHRTPDALKKILADFERQEGQVCICVAGKSAHLAGVVASKTLLPVLAVPVFNPDTAGFDSLLSMVQMPGGIPVATFGFGNSGFTNACLNAAQIVALKDNELKARLLEDRVKQAEQVVSSDKEYSVSFEG